MSNNNDFLTTTSLLLRGIVWLRLELSAPSIPAPAGYRPRSSHELYRGAHSLVTWGRNRHSYGWPSSPRQSAELLKFAIARMSDVCWKRNEFPSARFGRVRSVFSQEWAPEVKADPVQGLTASDRREFCFALGNATGSVPFRFRNGNDFRCFAHARS